MQAWSLTLTVALALSPGWAMAAAKSTAQRPGAATSQKVKTAQAGFDASIGQNSHRLLQEGQRIFRYDTFGDESFWGDQLKLHEAIAGEKHGGIGPGLTPKAALGAGLKVDANAIPKKLASQIKAGKVNLDDPATTIALVKLDAVIGLGVSFPRDPDAPGVEYVVTNVYWQQEFELA